MPEQSYTAEELWQRFREEFRKGLEEPCKGTSEERLRTAWNRGEKARTQYYGGCLLPRTAIGVGMELHYEQYLYQNHRMAADWIMVDRRTSEPRIVIESENQVEKVDGSEIPDLCRCTVPVKVLITCSVWRDGQIIEQRLERWRSLIRQYNQRADEQGIFGTIIGEWFPQWEPKGTLTFHCYSLVLDSSDESWTLESPLFQRYISDG